MNRPLLLSAAAVLLAGIAPARAADSPPPKGWIQAGSAPADYEMVLDRSQARTGRSSALIRARKPSPDGFATLMQNVVPDDYKGKRVRFSGWVKADGVLQWSGLWMRVDGAEKRNPLAFDNMQSRPINGTRGWTRYEVVLDVAPEAVNLAFGILLHGPGAVWLDDAAIEVVPLSVPSTGTATATSNPHPTNLTFEE